MSKTSTDENGKLKFEIDMLKSEVNKLRKKTDDLESKTTLMYINLKSIMDGNGTNIKCRGKKR